MIAQKIVLHFPPELVDQPIISNIVKKYGLVKKDDTVIILLNNDNGIFTTTLMEVRRVR